MRRALRRCPLALALALLLGLAGCEQDVGRAPSAAPGASSTTLGTAAGAGPQAVRFGVWGDTPYGAAEAALIPDLVEEMNAADLDFSVHVGDIKDGGTPCDDAEYERAVDTFEQFSSPLVYVPGDNEWTDCHRSGQDPLERLDHLRGVMFPTGRSFGRESLALHQQRPSFPELSRWEAGPVVGIGLNVPGGNNSHVADATAPEPGTGRAAAEAEFLARDQAAVDWLDAGFDAALAAGAAAVVVVMQADPHFDVPAADRAARGVDGFDRLLAALLEQSGRFPGPVVVVHGDTHRFRHDRPLVDPATGRPVPNVVRVETYGSPFVGWVEVTIDPGAGEPVRAEPHLVVAPPGS